MGTEIGHRVGDAVFVIVGCERDRHQTIGERFVAHGNIGLAPFEEEQEVDERERQPGDDRHAAVPH